MSRFFIYPGSGAQAHTAEVEPQDHAARSRERLGTLEHDLGVHRAALDGQRVREHDRRARRARRLVDEDLEQS
jgi:hypothetical protein